jgi:hypothetical protein
MTTTPPEAAGPGSAQPDGSVIYGVEAPRQAQSLAHLPPLQQVENPRCDRCMAIPDDVITSITSALRTAAREGRPR